jgi:hypothetical protein
LTVLCAKREFNHPARKEVIYLPADFLFRKSGLGPRRRPVFADLSIFRVDFQSHWFYNGWGFANVVDENISVLSDE